MSAFLQGATNTTINGGNFTAVSNTVPTASSQNDIVTILFHHSATAGLLDAAERFDAPRCDEDTRISMLRGMKKFVQDGGSFSSPALYWLHGPAGVGKSALAQSLSLLLDSEGDHAASFFFSRTSPGRNNGNQFIVTLAYQLAINVPQLQGFMSKIVRKNPAILTASNAAQMQSLIIDPITQWHKSYRRSIWRWTQKILNINKKLHPRLILVDGLDECNDPDVQRDLILCIASAAHQLSLPFRFVIASRPESHILATFELDPAFQGLSGVKVTKKNLGDDEDADEQITAFLLNQFAEIRRTHPVRKFLPQSWPLPGQIAELVSKSSKGFIYPATVVRYIKMPKSRPDECLERILGLSAIPTQDKPYEPLDHLYRQIFDSLPDTNKASVRGIFHFLVIPGAISDSITPRIIERHFGFKPGHVEHVLHDLLCLVALRTCDDPITVLHASLPDFLLDHSRSGSLCIDIGDAHATVAASFHQLFAPGHRFESPMFDEFLDHLIRANTTDGLCHVLSKFDLVEEYREIWEIKTLDGEWVRHKDASSDRVLRCITFLIAYLLVITIIKKLPTSQIMKEVHALEAFVVQRFPLAAVLHDQAIDEKIFGDIIPALRHCVVMYSKCIKTNPEFDAVHSRIMTDMWRLYFLILSPFFTSPAENTRSSVRDDAQAHTTAPSDKYSQIARALLTFLMSGTRPSLLMSKSRYLDQGSELLRKLAISIIAAALAESSYSASLVVQLTQLLGAVYSARTVRGDKFLESSFQQLAPIIASYGIRVQSEASASMDSTQINQLGDLMMYISVGNF